MILPRLYFEAFRWLAGRGLAWVVTAESPHHTIIQALASGAECVVILLRGDNGRRGLARERVLSLRVSMRWGSWGAMAGQGFINEKGLRSNFGQVVAEGIIRSSRVEENGFVLTTTNGTRALIRKKKKAKGHCAAYCRWLRTIRDRVRRVVAIGCSDLRYRPVTHLSCRTDVGLTQV